MRRFVAAFAGRNSYLPAKPDSHFINKNHSSKFGGASYCRFRESQQKASLDPMLNQNHFMISRAEHHEFRWGLLLARAAWTI
jgi:hypothetical protein